MMYFKKSELATAIAMAVSQGAARTACILYPNGKLVYSFERSPGHCTALFWHDNDQRWELSAWVRGTGGSLEMRNRNPIEVAGLAYADECIARFYRGWDNDGGPPHDFCASLAWQSQAQFFNELADPSAAVSTENGEEFWVSAALERTSWYCNTLPRCNLPLESKIPQIRLIRQQNGYVQWERVLAVARYIGGFSAETIESCHKALDNAVHQHRNGELILLEKTEQSNRLLASRNPR